MYHHMVSKGWGRREARGRPWLWDSRAVRLQITSQTWGAHSKPPCCHTSKGALSRGSTDMAWRLSVNPHHNYKAGPTTASLPSPPPAQEHTRAAPIPLLSFYLVLTAAAPRRSEPEELTALNWLLERPPD